MEIAELNKHNKVQDFIKIPENYIVEVLDSGNIKKSRDLSLSIERLSDNRILFFKIPSIKYESLDSVFIHDITNDIYQCITDRTEI